MTTFYYEKCHENITEVKIKGGQLFKEKKIHLSAIRCHPDWWENDNNFVLCMTPNDTVTLLKCSIKPGKSEQDLTLDPLENGKNRLSWIKDEMDQNHKVAGLKATRNDAGEEVSTTIWMKTLNQKDFDEVTIKR